MRRHWDTARLIIAIATAQYEAATLPAKPYVLPRPGAPLHVNFLASASHIFTDDEDEESDDDDDGRRDGPVPRALMQKNRAYHRARITGGQ